MSDAPGRTPSASRTATGNTDILTSRPMSVQSVINGATKRLVAAGIDTARSDAEVMLADFLACERLKILTAANRILTTEEVDRFTLRVERRATRCPLQYVLGRTEFLHRSFRVSPAVLVPRPETEQLVEEALKSFEGLPPDRRLTVIDLGTGSGVIAVSLALATAQARLFAVDVDPQALTVARDNAAALGAEHKITFIEGDLFAPLAGFGLEGAVDLVVANPPYVAAGEIAGLQPEVRDFEPRHALDGGPDGLAVVRRLLADAERFLKPRGQVLIEIGFGQVPLVREFLASHDDFDNILFLKDYQGIERILKASYYPWAARLQS